MKYFLALLATVFSVCAAHAAVFNFDESNRLGGGTDPDVDIGNVFIQLTNPSTGEVDFAVATSGLTEGLEIINVFFTVDFDVNEGGLGLPLVSVLDPAGKGGSYAVDEGGFDPVDGISADAVQRFDTGNGGLVQGNFFGGEFQRFNIPPDDGDLTVMNFTQVAIQIEGQGYFGDPIVPVPVPASLPLLAGGLGLAVFALRKSKRKYS